VRAPRTLAADLDWQEISDLGTLYSFTVARRPVGPHFADAVPQLLAIVEWDEGPRLSTEMSSRRICRWAVFCGYPEHDGPCSDTNRLEVVPGWFGTLPPNRLTPETAVEMSATFWSLKSGPQGRFREPRSARNSSTPESCR